MNIKAGDFVKFKNFEDMSDDSRYKINSNSNTFHKNNMGKKLKVHAVEDSNTFDPRVILKKSQRFRFKAERFRKCSMEFELDDNLFQI